MKDSKKPWFDSVCGCLHSLNDGVMRGTDVVNGRKHALLVEYDDVGNIFGSALQVIVALRSTVLDAAVAFTGWRRGAILSSFSSVVDRKCFCVNRPQIPTQRTQGAPRTWYIG